MQVRCKKADIAQEENIDSLIKKEAPVRKFFGANSSTRPEITAIIGRIKTQEQKTPFLETFVTYAGYPDWDKSLTLARPERAATTLGKTTNVSASEMVIVPFSFENDSALNAILKVTLSSEDTTFQMLYRWQYNQHGYVETNTVNNADQTALFFMAYESFLFGHRSFRIKDTLLLKDKRSSDVITIKSFSVAGNSAAIMLSNTIEICYQSDCPPPAQARQMKVAATWGICVSCSNYTYWYEDGSSGGGNIAGSSPSVGSGSGGGGSAGDGAWSDAPPCVPSNSGVSLRVAGREGCDNPPAWEPVEELPIIIEDLPEPPFVWSYNDEDDVVGGFIDNFPANKPSFQFLPEDNYETKYPEFTKLVKNLKSFVMSNRKVISALKKWSGLSEQMILDHLNFGEGPIIKIGGISGSYGYFRASENPAVLNIREYYVNQLEAAPLSYQRESLAFLLAVTILHEYVHFSAHLNGISEGAYEFGNNFERKVFNVIVNTDNMGQISIDFKKYFK